jgi:hypothetical protein
MTEALSKPMSAEDSSILLSSRRTGRSFQRTRMSADRTLMSGCTDIRRGVAQFRDSVLLGIVMLIGGIFYDLP